ncbi:hypothetical protein GGS21DRAFT_208099 [Xylaria nigripes]|nr:hypothetical protein GGS21DRAFT_208099 [Xylaria nigripes]
MKNLPQKKKEDRFHMKLHPRQTWLICLMNMISKPIVVAKSVNPYPQIPLPSHAIHFSLPFLTFTAPSRLLSAGIYIHSLFQTQGLRRIKKKGQRPSSSFFFFCKKLGGISDTMPSTPEKPQHRGNAYGLDIKKEKDSPN